MNLIKNFHFIILHFKVYKQLLVGLFGTGRSTDQENCTAEKFEDSLFMNFDKFIGQILLIKAAGEEIWEVVI